ncbi:hypothetical protein RclHR1_13420002 [Rhizophagus clarus]|uniref:UBX domain protein n=1 Tax=Rhizophagus clarus TaxID=94130 RepID=A0A2Z6Q9Z9_9GLOM|nr:hypothetical protein RclHR1_13420002 [Rhizophagus clarus]GES75434.1 UBX domain protein [Rhizophagus clarus]
MTFEDKIAEFCNTTGESEVAAATYLELTGGDVLQAINLYLEMGGADLSGVLNTSTTTNQQSTSTASADAERTRNMIEADEELARALAQQENSSIRAPIAPKREILVGGDQNDHVSFDGIARRSVPRSNRSRDNNFQNRTFAGNALPHRMGPSDEKATRLADLYAPPFDIINKENFERTRNRAKNENKWVMVDIQNIREFSCQVLNRDLWNNNAVKEVIKAHFLFLQFNSESPDGRQYVNYYPIDSYPHIAIIDPRTGERVKVLNATKLSPNEFIMLITDFLDSYSLTDQKKSTSSRSATRLIEEESSRERPAYDFNDEIDEIEDTEEEDDSTTEEPTSIFDSIQPVEREEAQGPTSAMIKFRLADGQTVIRRFEKMDPVRYLFEFIKTVPNLKDQEFELVCHRNNLINQVNQTVEDAGLSNSLVNVVLG